MNVQASPSPVLSRGRSRQAWWHRCWPAGGRHLGDARPGWPQGLLAASAALVTVTLAACSSPAALVSLPSKAGSTAAPAAQAALTPPTPRQQIVAAYSGYNNALQQAQDSRKAALVRTIMAGYVPASSLSAFVSAFKGEWRHGEIAYGSVVSHILHVRLIGKSEAVVDDCLDTTHSGLQDFRSGAVVPGTLGTGHDNLATTMVLQHGRWLVSTQIPVEVQCAY